MTATPAQAAWTHGQLRAYQAIRVVWPKHYRAARQVARCESDFRKWAENGQYHNVFQLSANWRHYFHVRDGQLWRGLYAAHAIYKADGFHWYQWECQPA